MKRKELKKSCRNSPETPTKQRSANKKPQENIREKEAPKGKLKKQKSKRQPPLKHLSTFHSKGYVSQSLEHMWHLFSFSRLLSYETLGRTRGQVSWLRTFGYITRSARIESKHNNVPVYQPNRDYQNWLVSLRIRTISNRK